jgi:serine protease Do
MPSVREWLGKDYVLPWGDSDAVVAGDLVLALGAPVGLHNTVSVGAVTAPRRYMLYGNRVALDPYNIQAGRCINYIQHDAPINGGNSGGPLLNAKGQVVGMNTLGYTGMSGLAFSEPSNYIKVIAQNIIDCARDKYKYPVKRGWAGLEFDTFTDVVDPELSGLKVINVFKYSPCYGKLDKGNVIVAMNGQPVAKKANGQFLPLTKEDIAPFQQMIASSEAGSTMTFTVLQGADRKDIAITIPAAHPLDSYQFEVLHWALVLFNNSPTVAKHANVTETTGVYVEANSTPSLQQSGFGGFSYRDSTRPWTNSAVNAGDVIIAVDGQKVADVAEFFDLYLKNLRARLPVVKFTIVDANGRQREASFDPKKK